MGEEISSNLAVIRNRVKQAAERAGRDPRSVQLLVVSKTWPADKVAVVADAGHTCFGENKVQEAEGKVPQLPQNLNWHLIGHLQRNKVRKALRHFNTIHSIDSLKLARHTSHVAMELGEKPNIYLQVNLAEEENKNGYVISELKRDINDLLALPSVSIVGLMCIPPAAESSEQMRPWFVKMRELRDELEDHTGAVFPGLSMGMSSDFEVAIEEGATIVRVGSAIFGTRNYL
ncbi:MAG: YggS family pyridoxal phosphate-dependent enzyme [Akkermansiaceae bacterium]|jgi:PLP dependent protein|nr:YggS family pyridoxal phosphate-dependent enzyme [Akkermansiaceae bacterium]